jgi:GT2 family glycosyltransferase
MRTQLSKNRKILFWVIQSRSWKITSGLRRLNFLNQRKYFRPALNGNCFQGVLEKPVENETVSGYLEVSGWVYSTAAPIKRVEVFLDYVPLGILRPELPRPDLLEYPSNARLNCGYEGQLLIENSFAGNRTLAVRVTDTHGNIKDFIRTISIAHSIEEVGDILISPASETSQLNGSLPLDDLSALKNSLTVINQAELNVFLISNQTLEFPKVENPQVSIILVLYNRAELTLQCLFSILKSNFKSYEVIIVDNGSTDETRQLLERIGNARVILNNTNVHFLRACNQAGKEVRGEYILFLNNDAQLQSGSIDSALKTINSSEDIGAVGGKIILPDGTLQEAGSIIWRDGSAQGYGRGDSPFAPEYMFKRDVDYCSGAFLLTRSDLFLIDNGFDEAFSPAYYEETDYCVRLWKQGKRIVYDPDAAIVHYEFASSQSKEGAISLQIEHREVFVKQHRQWLQSQFEPSPANLLVARSRAKHSSKRILFIEDRVPHLTLGSGFPRSNDIVREMVRMKHSVTCYPLNFPHENWISVYQDIPQEVEVMTNYGTTELENFLVERRDYYDIILVSRPHNMKTVGALLKMPHLRSKAKIIYDAEALFSLRDIELLRLKGTNLSEDEIQVKVEEEIRLADGSDCIVSVTERESNEFRQRGFNDVHVLGHALSPSPTLNSFDKRKDLLFIGALHTVDSPNADSLFWFYQEIFPKFQEKLGSKVNLIVVGDIHPEIRNLLTGESIQIKGKVRDLTHLYNHARIFIAPTRYAAGIPHKVHQAAAYGLPSVTTPLIAGQLGWHHNEELLSASDEETFANACVQLYQDERLWSHLRENALTRIVKECSPKIFRERLQEIIEN